MIFMGKSLVSCQFSLKPIHWGWVFIGFIAWPSATGELLKIRGVFALLWHSCRGPTQELARVEKDQWSMLIQLGMAAKWREMGSFLSWYVREQTWRNALGSQSWTARQICKFQSVNPNFAWGKTTIFLRQRYTWTFSLVVHPRSRKWVGSPHSIE